MPTDHALSMWLVSVAGVFGLVITLAHARRSHWAEPAPSLWERLVVGVWRAFVLGLVFVNVVGFGFLALVDVLRRTY